MIAYNVFMILLNLIYKTVMKHNKNSDAPAYIKVHHLVKRCTIYSIFHGRVLVLQNLTFKFAN